MEEDNKNIISNDIVNDKVGIDYDISITTIKSKRKN